MACRNLLKLFAGHRFMHHNRHSKVTLSKFYYVPNCILRLCPPAPKEFAFSPKTKSFAISLSILTWLGFAEEDEHQESELIMTLKRAILCKQREQFAKAEQMLHLALRLAQQQQNQQGVLYCYDLMANLAMDTFQLEKAQKLFVSVLQMLLSGGGTEEDLKVIHISLKLARISQLNANIEQAELGYQWCMNKIEKQKNDSDDTKMLYGVIQDWYAQFLLDKGEIQRAMIHLRKAYEACKETKGESDGQSMLLLNDLATASFRAGDLDIAVSYLKEAINVGSKIEDKTHLGVVHANLGLILLEKGVAKEAEKYCQEAWKLGKRYENQESIEQANYCFDQIKMTLGK